MQTTKTPPTPWAMQTPLQKLGTVAIAVVILWVVIVVPVIIIGAALNERSCPELEGAGDTWTQEYQTYCM